MTDIVERNSQDQAAVLAAALTDVSEEFRRIAGYEAIERDVTLAMRQLCHLADPNNPQNEIDRRLDLDEARRKIDEALVRIPGASLLLSAALEHVLHDLSGFAGTTLDLGPGQGNNSSRLPRDFARVGSAVEMPVLYVTNREGGEGSFGNDYSKKSSWGVARVSIPDDHRIGVLESPRWWRFEFKRRPKKHVCILEMVPVSSPNDLGSIIADISSSTCVPLLLFLHGYNVSFEDAILRTAQLAFDIEYPGIPVAFSWPSKAQVASYFADANVSGASVFQVSDALDALIDAPWAEHIVTLGHSMGGRLLAHSLTYLRSQVIQHSRRMPEVVFAAPDIDAELFEQLLARVPAGVGRRTLYVARDLALWVSRKVQGGRVRAGQRVNLGRISADVDVIDATSVDTSMIGHSWYGDSRSVISDLYDVFRGKSVEERRHLARTHGPNGRFWKIRA